MDKTLVIMAAGMGARYGGLKQIDPVGPDNSKIIDYSIYDARRAGFNKVVFIIKHEIEDIFMSSVGDRISKQIDTRFVFQELNDIPAGFSVPAERKKPWGTGQAILTCKGVVSEPFLVINADDFYGRTSFIKVADWIEKSYSPDEKAPYSYAMAGYILKNTLTENGHVARGVCRVDDKGCLSDVTERTKIMRINGETAFSEDEKAESWTPVDENSYVSMNMWCFTPHFFDELENHFVGFLSTDGYEKREFLLPEVVKRLLSEKKCTVRVLPTEEKWFGVTYKEDKDKVMQSIREKIAAGEYPAKLF